VNILKRDESNCFCQILTIQQKAVKNMKKRPPYNLILFKIMRIVIVQVFAIVAFTGLALALDSKAQGLLDKKISLEIENKSVAHALNRLEKVTDVKFIYSPEVIQGERKVSIHATNEALNTILESLLSPLNLTFEVIGKQIVVRKTPATGSLSVEPMNVIAMTITGKVVSDQGETLPGVSIVLKGTNSGTATDANGNYSLVAPDGTGTLIFSFIGYTTEEVQINNRTVIDMTLLPDIKSLQEVVVTALGIKREQKALGYAVSTVTSEQLTRSGNTNFASALYGKAAGVKITTAPGGASSAVNVQIRGVNSLGYNQQPLYVVDGIVIRNDNQNGPAGANNGNYWDDQRIRGNGILDINPADIETLSVLSGASATALYGSDATNGVIIITTKKGTKGRGLGVDLNYTASVEQAAFLPKFQNVYGPGYDRATNLSTPGATADGWLPDTNPASPGGVRPRYSGWAQFGPKMDGRQVRWWDGSIRSYSAHPDNYKDIFDTGYNSNLNVALSNQNDMITYRLSATHMDYKGTNPGSKQQRTTFNLNSTVKLNSKVSTDIVVSYMNTLTHNRAYQLGQVLGSYSGFFSQAEDMKLMREKYQTSEGYKYSTLNSGRPEAFVYNMSGANLLDFYWNQERNSYDETENRLLSSATLSWDIVNHLKVRGRIGNDYTGLGIDDKRYNERALAYNDATSSTGGYSISKGQYSILYGDALLTYSNKIGTSFDISASGGFQSRSENYKDQNSSTNNGLVTENWFSLSNSYGVANTTATRKEMLKYAYFGMLNLSYKDFLFLEGTARQEYSSTLPPANNSYFYPSVNASFVFTDALSLPSILSFGKLRASYAVVGNAAPIYESNISYTQTSLQTAGGSVPSLTIGGAYGNSMLRPEMKYEQEFGLETKILNNRLGLDISYYSNIVKDQILGLSTAPSNGANSQLINVGEIGSRGVEIALNASPISTTDFKWNTRLNYAFNRSRVISLAPGVTEIVFNESEQSSIKVVANVGETLGNIYVYPRATDANGNLLISDDGLYVIDKSRYVKAGNIMPKAIGGFSNTLSYKNFSLDFTIDYRFGGQMLSNPTKYAIGAGRYESTLEYRDAEHGGLAYTADGATYNDGVLLQGLNQNTGEPNTKVISAADYYLGTFYWGYDAWNEKGAVFDNSYIKLREATLSYQIPSAIASKLRLSNIRFSLIGRNLFYLWKTLEHLDPEAPLGNKWYSQGIDVGSSAATRSYGFSLHASF
jgi:iron complex outermembrane receptor protein